jgi:hypothetical protein
MSDVIIQCQLLHEATQTVWEFDHQVVAGGDEWHQFQNGDPSLSGAVYVRDYIAPIQDEADA